MSIGEFHSIHVQIAFITSVPFSYSTIFLIRAEECIGHPEACG